MRRIGYRVFLFLLITIFALGLGCDSSSDNGGGGQTATGYTQADLAGEWGMSGLRQIVGGQFQIPTNRAWITFDDQGKVLRLKIQGAKISRWTGGVTVSSDGSLEGQVCLGPNGGLIDCFVFNDMRLESKERMFGKMVLFFYDHGGPKNYQWAGPVRMTRYPSK